jgi:hypothetical protein
MSQAMTLGSLAHYSVAAMQNLLEQCTAAIKLNGALTHGVRLSGL